MYPHWDGGPTRPDGFPLPPPRRACPFYPPSFRPEAAPINAFLATRRAGPRPPDVWHVACVREGQRRRVDSLRRLSVSATGHVERGGRRDGQQRFRKTDGGREGPSPVARAPDRPGEGGISRAGL